MHTREHTHTVYINVYTITQITEWLRNVLGSCRRCILFAAL